MIVIAPEQIRNMFAKPASHNGTVVQRHVFEVYTEHQQVQVGEEVLVHGIKVCVVQSQRTVFVYDDKGGGKTKPYDICEVMETRGLNVEEKLDA